MIVEKRVFELPEFLLGDTSTKSTVADNPVRIADVRIGYETYGTLSPAADNAILILHFFNGDSHAAGRYHESDPEPGWWDAIIGPGKAIDTDRFFVIACDSLSNCNVRDTNVVTTGPATIDPATGRSYGAGFPVVTMLDFVNVQRALIEELGVEKLYAVGGPSMGAMQAMEWAATYPEMVDRVIAAVSPGLSAEPYLISMIDAWCAPIRLDPDFKDGNYEPDQGPIRGLTETMKLALLSSLGDEQVLRQFGRRWAQQLLDPKRALTNKFAIERSIEDTAIARARMLDANSFLRLAKAIQLFSIEDRLDRLRQDFLFISNESDRLMLPSYARRGMETLRARGLQVSLAEIEGDGGHLDGLNRIGKVAPEIARFFEE